MGTQDAPKLKPQIPQIETQDDHKPTPRNFENVWRHQRALDDYSFHRFSLLQWQLLERFRPGSIVHELAVNWKSLCRLEGAPLRLEWSETFQESHDYQLW